MPGPGADKTRHQTVFPSREPITGANNPLEGTAAMTTTTRDRRAQVSQHAGTRDQYRRIQAIAKHHGWKNTAHALPLSRHLHHGQARDSGGPYLSHPIRVALLLHDLGIHADYLIAAALLHDVMEDCKERISAKVLVRLHALDAQTMTLVQLLTKDKSQPPEPYFARITSCWEASLIKLADRADNLATMDGAFIRERARKYIEETRSHIIPLCTASANGNVGYPSVFEALRQKIEDLITEAEHTYR
jgi:(p)ppGpp synthase/HD superfamily hydrolase